MRKKLTIQRQTIRQLTVAERAAIIGGVQSGTTTLPYTQWVTCVDPPRLRETDHIDR